MKNLYGLILCGGFSSRLNQPKHLVLKNNLPLWFWWTQLLNKYCQQVYVSCRKEQSMDFGSERLIVDEYQSEGPLSGIVSAISVSKINAWFVVACDLVYVTERDIIDFVANRNPAKQATAFFNPETNSPFALLTIYEPTIFSNLLSEWSTERKSAYRVISASDTHLLTTNNPLLLKGINSIEDLSKWKDFEPNL
ncbi:MAG: NTP transferase domain-containing protein [Bacteroidota bacterium]|nr:NTP transferase domain-containing protein [Bacteroidota bacterium]